MMSSYTAAHPRRGIYYWKCDRPAAFHGTLDEAHRPALEEGQLHSVLRARFPGQEIALQPAGGQGNHVTYRATLDGTEVFVRLEDGPEQDDYMEVESCVMAEVRGLGVATPRLLAVDASRQEAPFAWQVMEYNGQPDLNEWQK